MAGSTATLALPFPDGADDADVPTHVQNLAERVETLMLRSGEIATHAPAAPDAGKLVICQADGHLAYKTISGDLNISQSGVATIPPGALAGVELQDNSIGTRALDANAVAQENMQDDSVGAAEIIDGDISRIHVDTDFMKTIRSDAANFAGDFRFLLNWPTPWPDANYTAVAIARVMSGSSTPIAPCSISEYDAAHIGVWVNAGGGGARTFEVNVVGFHD